MIVYVNSRSEARSKAKRRGQWSIVDKGEKAPQGQRWGVRIY